MAKPETTDIESFAEFLDKNSPDGKDPEIASAYDLLNGVEIYHAGTVDSLANEPKVAFLGIFYAAARCRARYLDKYRRAVDTRDSKIVELLASHNPESFVDLDQETRRQKQFYEFIGGVICEAGEL